MDSPGTPHNKQKSQTIAPLVTSLSRVGSLPQWTHQSNMEVFGIPPAHMPLAWTSLGCRHRSRSPPFPISCIVLLKLSTELCLIPCFQYTIHSTQSLRLGHISLVLSLFSNEHTSKLTKLRCHSSFCRFFLWSMPLVMC